QLSNYSTNDLDNERIEESDSNTIETSTSSPANNLDHKRIEESN
ncbi:24671_t:CDS:1, partial [Gigaspora rosea]